MAEEVVLVVAAVVVGGVVAQWLGWRIGIPAIVFLLAGGIVAGPILGGLRANRVFGDLLFPFVSLAVAIILFEGALGLGERRLRHAGRTVWFLISIGAAVTFGLIAGAARITLGVGWDVALVLGAVLLVTGPTVIGPIVRAIGLKGRLAAVLEAEGTLIDPIGAILAVLVFEAVYETGDGPGSIAGALTATLLIGAAIGAVTASLLVVALARFWIPSHLQNVATLAGVVGAFAAANTLRTEAGLVSVTIMGFLLASQTRVSVRHVLRFNETLRILLVSSVFILLGASITADTLRTIEWRNLAFAAVLVIIVRPLSVVVSTFRSDLTRSEKVFLAATAPRGIVAAAVASVFALQLTELEVGGGQTIVSATFTVIAVTVLLSGFGSRPLARRLALVDERTTVVILGATAVARAFASALEQHGASVRIVDLDREQGARARMEGLSVHHGSIFADETWDAIEIESAARFLAMTTNDELNVLAARHAAATIGRQGVYQVVPRRAEHAAWWTLQPGIFARPLCSPSLTIEELADRIENGWKVTATQLTEQFGPDDYARTHPDAIVLFTRNAGEEIEIASGDTRHLPRNSLVVAMTEMHDTND